MKLKDFRFKLTDTETGESAILDFDDLYAYEGETCGVLIEEKDHIPPAFWHKAINLNSGYDHCGINEKWEIEPYIALDLKSGKGIANTACLEIREALNRIDEGGENAHYNR